MKLSDETLTILKNYASINQNIQFKQGSTLSTFSPQKNILTIAQISENIPSTFAIYDLNKFLGALSLFHKPELTVGEKHLKINGGGSELNYVCAEASMLHLPPEKTFEFPNPEIKFKMDKDDYDSCMKASQILSLPEFIVEGDGTETRSFCYIDDAIIATKIVHKDNTFDNRIFKSLYIFFIFSFLLSKFYVCHIFGFNKIY